LFYKDRILFIIKIFYIIKLVTDLNKTLDLVGNVEDITE